MKREWGGGQPRAFFLYQPELFFGSPLKKALTTMHSRSNDREGVFGLTRDPPLGSAGSSVFYDIIIILYYIILLHRLFIYYLSFILYINFNILYYDILFYDIIIIRHPYFPVFF